MESLKAFSCSFQCVNVNEASVNITVTSVAVLEVGFFWFFFLIAEMTGEIMARCRVILFVTEDGENVEAPLFFFIEHSCVMSY